MDRFYVATYRKAMMRIGILGASRGLGAALEKVIRADEPLAQLQLFSRTHGMDFTKPEYWGEYFEKLSALELDKIFYVAGGGPHGNFAEKDWKDHSWAFRLNFEFPAKLLHHFLRHPGPLKQILFVGSSIAEDKPDPGAASYSAAKHALKGLLESVMQEQPSFDIRLYSPGYMDTDMLPKNAWPRQQAMAESPHDVARRLWQWSQSTVECGSFQEATHVRSES